MLLPAISPLIATSLNWLPLPKSMADAPVSILFPDKPRSKEVLTWLSEHPEATRYAIIDDEDDDLDELPLFQPSCHTGITKT